jgi:hypothetical protein
MKVGDLVRFDKFYSNFKDVVGVIVSLDVTESFILYEVKWANYPNKFYEKNTGLYAKEALELINPKRKNK